MPIEVIDLLSSPDLPRPAISRVVRKTPSTTAPSAKALTYEPQNSDWFTLSSDNDAPLPPLPSAKPPTILARPKSNLSTATNSRDVDWLPPLSSDDATAPPPLPSRKSSKTFTEPSSKPTHFPSTSKGPKDFFFLSDDFDSSVNLDDPIDLNAPAAKKRRVSSPKAASSKSLVPKATGYKRSVSNIEASTKMAGRRTTSASVSKRASTISEALELDPLVFTSSPDPFADAARRRKEKRKSTWEEDSAGSDIFDLDPGKSTRGILEAGDGNRSKNFSTITESSDIDLPDIDTLQSKVVSKNSSKSSQTALSKYNAEKAKEKKAKERSQKTKEFAAAKEAEKEKKRSAKEEKVREKEKAAEIAKVNTLRTDKKISTPEMIVDLPSSLDPNLAAQARTFLTGLQVEHTEWESLLPIIKWRRKVVAVYNEEMGHYEPTVPHIKNEKHIMCIMSAQEFVDLATGEEDKHLDVHILRLKAKFDSCEIIFLMQGYNAWMRKNRNVKNRQFAQAVRSQMSQEEQSTTGQRRKKKEAEYVDEDLIEDAMLRLQVIHGALIHHTTVMNETAEWIATFTQHISTIPYRTQKQSLDTAFCMESGQVKTGDGAADTYNKMLQEIVRITAPVAYGISAEYPTLRKLVDGLEKNGPLALENCRKSANKDGAFTDRRVGPAISKRVYKVFTGKDPSSLDV